MRDLLVYFRIWRERTKTRLIEYQSNEDTRMDYSTWENLYKETSSSYNTFELAMKIFKGHNTKVFSFYANVLISLKHVIPGRLWWTWKTLRSRAPKQLLKALVYNCWTKKLLLKYYYGKCKRILKEPSKRARLGKERIVWTTCEVLLISNLNLQFNHFLDSFQFEK